MRSEKFFLSHLGAFGGLILSHPLAGALGASCSCWWPSEAPLTPLSPPLSTLCMTIHLPSPWATTMPAAVVWCLLNLWLALGGLLGALLSRAFRAGDVEAILVAYSLLRVVWKQWVVGLRSRNSVCVWWGINTGKRKNQPQSLCTTVIPSRAGFLLSVVVVKSVDGVCFGWREGREGRIEIKG